jgi:hypothetical protein
MYSESDDENSHGYIGLPATCLFAISMERGQDRSLGNLSNQTSNLPTIQDGWLGKFICFCPE